MDAVQKEVPHVIKALLPFLCPGEWNGLAVDAAGEFGERPDDMGIIGDESSRLDKDAERLAQFRYIGGWDHASDGVEVFVG